MSKPVKGFPGYTITKDGTISRNGNKINPRKDDDGYMIVDLWKNGKRSTKFVHRLVAENFSGGAGEETDHKDKDRTNNSADNLEGTSHKENLKRTRKK